MRVEQRKSQRQTYPLRIWEIAPRAYPYGSGPVGSYLSWMRSGSRPCCVNLLLFRDFVATINQFETKKRVLNKPSTVGDWHFRKFFPVWTAARKLLSFLTFFLFKKTNDNFPAGIDIIKAIRFYCHLCLKGLHLLLILKARFQNVHDTFYATLLFFFYKDMRFVLLHCIILQFKNSFPKFYSRCQKHWYFNCVPELCWYKNVLAIEIE